MKHIIRITALLAAIAAPSFAQVTNGDFSSGLAGWTPAGDVATRTGGAFLTTASLVNDDDNTGVGAFNFSGTDVVASADLESLFGLFVGALDPDPVESVFAYEGSVIFRTINVQAGEILTFERTFFTNEANGFDYSFTIIGQSVSVTTNPFLFPLTPTSTYGYSFTTGTQVFNSSPFAESGTVTIGFGVVDASDFVSTSALLIDNISVIPEPSSFAALAGLVGLGFAASRRRACA